MKKFEIICIKCQKDIAECRNIVTYVNSQTIDEGLEMTVTEITYKCLTCNEEETISV